MRGNRIIVSDIELELVIKLAHEGYQGIVRTKNSLKSKVWWPELYKMVENKTKNANNVR